MPTIADAQFIPMDTTGGTRYDIMLNNMVIAFATFPIQNLMVVMIGIVTIIMCIIYGYIKVKKVPEPTYVTEKMFSHSMNELIMQMTALATAVQSTWSNQQRYPAFPAVDPHSEDTAPVESTLASLRPPVPRHTVRVPDSSTVE